jgi:predicted permease
MRLIDALRRRLRLFTHRAAAERELDDELRFHLESEVDDLVARGVPIDEARRRARASFGGVQQVKEQVRDTWHVRALRDAAQDLRYGVRTLRRGPSFSIAAILTVAVGVGATTAIFSVVHGLLLKPLPYHEPDRIVAVLTSWTDSEKITSRVTVGDYADLARQGEVFDAISPYWGGEIGVRVGDTADFTGTYFVHPSFFRVFAVDPVRGRVFDEKEGGQAVVVSEGFASRHFGSPQAAIGQAIAIDGQPARIVGVTPASFAYPKQATVWVAAPRPSDRAANERTAFNYSAVARLRPGLPIEQARARLDAVGARLAAAYPDSNRTKRFTAAPLQDRLVRDLRPTVYLLFGAVLLLLLIACGNVSSLLLARATARTREMALRTALGAGRGRLVRQLLAESALVAAVGGALGIVAARVGTAALVRLAPPGTPRIGEVAVDGSVLLFATLVTLATSVVFGLAPAWQASRVEAQEALKQAGGRGAVGGHSTRLRTALVVGEIAAAVVLAVSGGLLFRSFVALSNVPLGFHTERMLVVYAHAPASTDDEYVRTAQAITDAVPALAALPGVRAAGAAMGLPAGDYSSFGAYAVEGLHQFAPGATLPSAGFRLASPGFFTTMGIPLLAGRDFGDGDRFDATRVAIVSRTLARQTFGASSPLGRRIQCGLDSIDPMTIVGVVDDVRHDSPADGPSAEIYMPLTQHPAYANEVQYVLRTAGEPLALTASVRAALVRALPGAATRSTTLETMVADSIATPRFRARLVGVFATLALLLATMGVFGVMSYVSLQRTPEFGVRLALGASPGDLWRLVLGKGLSVALAGIGIGTAVSLAVTRGLESMLFGLTPLDPSTWAVVVGLTLAATLVASAWPAWRASRIDPSAALRE